MCLLLSSNNLDILWVQKTLLLQPQTKNEEFIQIYADIIIDAIGDDAWLRIIHPGLVEDVRNETAQWTLDHDWIKDMMEEKLDARSIKQIDKEFYEIWYTENAIAKCRVGPTDIKCLRIWPDEKTKNRIIYENKWNIPLTLIVFDKIPRGCQVIRIAAKTKTGVHPSYSQTSFHIEGEGKVLLKVENMIDRVEDIELREDFFRIVDEWRLFNRKTLNMKKPRYDIVAFAHPECPTTLEKRSGEFLRDDRKIIEWPLKTAHSTSRLFILYPVDVNYDIEFISQVCPKVS